MEGVIEHVVAQAGCFQPEKGSKKVSYDAWFFEDATAPPSLSRRETRFELTFQFYRFSLKQSVRGLDVSSNRSSGTTRDSALVAMF